jgi:tetratricopeptide (TPR) repeat protein
MKDLQRDHVAAGQPARLERPVVGALLLADLLLAEGDVHADQDRSAAGGARVAHGAGPGAVRTVLARHLGLPLPADLDPGVAGAGELLLGGGGQAGVQLLGGGLDKAQALTERIKALDPVEYHYAQAKLAEKRKDFATTEQQLRRASDLAPKQIGRVIDLAKFLAKQGKVQESEAAFNRAAQIAPDDPQLLFERAATYIDAKRNLDTARELLKKYLEAPLKPENPSRA